MKLYSIILFCLVNLCSAQTYLSPLDFGLSMMDHGMVDYIHTPPNILCANYDGDCYPDIARFTGHKLEVFLFAGNGYSSEPQQSRTFDKPIRSLKLDDDIFDGIDDLVVTFEDNSTQTFRHEYGCLNLNPVITVNKPTVIPRKVSEADFEIVWESESYSYGMNACTVGDLDNDGINEFVTWWKVSYYDSAAWILIYKCSGDDEYELYMEEPFYTDDPTHPYLTYMTITDIDQNGLKELVYTRASTYFWEFTEPGVYTSWRSNINFPRGVQAVKISDVNQNGTLEVAALCSNPGTAPPTAYIVEEFNHKSESDSMIFFDGISGFYLEDTHLRFDVGDFDNDGAVDMVGGVFGWSIGQPVDIPYFRYDPSALNNFSENWLYTGVSATCAVPIIEDLDGDGFNELFASGVVPSNSSAFLYEGTNYGIGAVTWLDSTSSPVRPTECCFGYVDAQPAVLVLGFDYFPTPFAHFSLWSFQENSFSHTWYSGSIDSAGYNNPHLFDIDDDGKTDIILDDVAWKKTVVWEQTSAGIKSWNPAKMIESFQLYPIFPNPFNGTGSITYSLAKTANINLSLINIAGKRVFCFNQDNVFSGQYRMDLNTEEMASGIYILIMQIKNERQTQKMVILK